MFKKHLLFISILFAFVQLSAQNEDAWVFFKDKPNANSLINSPNKLLSQRALDRRIRYQIPVDEKDVPIEAGYISTIKQNEAIEILAKSKWLNAIHVKSSEAQILSLLELDFVKGVEFANKSLNEGRKIKTTKTLNTHLNKLKITTDFVYGATQNQIEMLGGDYLHQNNFTGEGVQIAILDAGFPNVDTFDAFQRLRDNSQILGGYNFVERNEQFYTRHSHGMSVLSTIAGYIENEFVGTAPNAEFYLFITEDSSQETPLEESLWVEAAEKADSLGVDIINTSLGYSTFDNANYNYSYEDMDGNSTFISRGAQIAFSRGMVLVNSAGNEGNDPWKYILSPADTKDVLTIGAVNADRTIAGFSSFGPTFDGRIKPDVCAQGGRALVINSSGRISTSNGTSFSSPIMAGVVACLWQAFPSMTNAELTQTIKEFSHLYNNPTAQEGHGIPNFKLLYDYLKEQEEAITSFSIYPNPTSERIFVQFPYESDVAEISIVDFLGKTILVKQLNKNSPSIDVSFLKKGMYILQIQTKENTIATKFIKE